MQYRQETSPNYTTFHVKNSYSEEESLKIWIKKFCVEFKALLILILPILVTEISHMMLGSISLIFIGHLNDLSCLNAAGLALNMINASTIAICEGLGTACCTIFALCNGSEEKSKLGILTQKAFILFMLVSLIVVSININFGKILSMTGQDPIISRLAGDYVVIFIPGSLSYFAYAVLLRYVQCQDVVLPNMIIGIIVNVLNSVLHYLFLFYFEWNIWGSALSLSISFCFLPILTLIYICSSGMYRNTWNGWSWKCLENWLYFCKLAFTGILAACQELWAFEIVVFISGLLSSTDLTLQTVIVQIDSMWYSIPLGIRIASSIKLGQSLGANDAKSAKTVTYLTFAVTTLVSILMIIITLIFRHRLPLLFTDVDYIVDETANVLCIYAVFMFFDATANVSKGILYAMGRQPFVAAASFISYYCFTLPIGFFFMFHTYLGSAAIWITFAVNMFLSSVTFLIIIKRLDWKVECQNTEIRSELDALDYIESNEKNTEPRVLLYKRIPLFLTNILVLISSIALYFILE